MDRICIVGLDEPEYSQIQERIEARVVAHEVLPRILVQDGELLVEGRRGPGWLPVSKIIYHSIFENDHDFIAALALWGGPCLPNIVPGGRTPNLSLSEIEAMGYRLAIFPGLLLQAAVVAGDAALAALKATQRPPEVTQSVAQAFRRFGADEWDALRSRFNAGATIGE